MSGGGGGLGGGGGTGAVARWDQITLKGISGQGYHGVYPEERRNGQPFSVDVTIYLDTRLAARTDDLADTVDYSQLATKISELISGDPVWLVERLAQQAADVALSFVGVKAVTVVVHKPQAPLTVPFSDVLVTIHRDADELLVEDRPLPGSAAALLERRPERERQVVLALGANLGDPVGTLRKAVAQLGKHPGLAQVAVSALVRTQAVLAPEQPPQPDYYNCVLTARSRMSANELWELAFNLEVIHGRVRAERWGARTLDIDIIDIEGLTSDDPRLIIPHPRAAQRAFVLVPWAALDGQAHLGGQQVSRLAEAAVASAGQPHLWEQWLEPGPVTQAIRVLDARQLAEADRARRERAGGPANRQVGLETIAEVAELPLPSWRSDDQPPRIVDDFEVDIVREDGTLAGGAAAGADAGLAGAYAGVGEALGETGSSSARPTWRPVQGEQP